MNQHLDDDPYDPYDPDYLIMRWAQRNKNLSVYTNFHKELILVRGWDYVRRQLEHQWKEASQ